MCEVWSLNSEIDQKYIDTLNLLSAVRKIQLKEGGHVLAKKYIDTLKLNLTCVIDQKTNLGRKPAQICIQILLFNTQR